MLIRLTIGDTDPIRYRRLSPGGQFSFNIFDAAIRHQSSVPIDWPELNPVERVWLYLKENFLSHRLLNDYDAIVDAAIPAWNALVAVSAYYPHSARICTGERLRRLV